MRGFKSDDYRIKPGKKAHLAKRPTDVEKFYESDDEYDIKLSHLKKELADRHEILYADQRFGVLVIFQGMDASGKDGAIKHVMSCLNPQGVSVTAFSSPSDEERRHDFLWRTHARLPARGKIGIFNRSYYEEVVTVRVHPDYLAAERIVANAEWDSDFWSGRCEDIAHHERALHRDGYQIIKFYLHISREEQKKRLLARIDEPEKNWKFDPADMVARSRWEKYREAYGDCLSQTSTKHAPWYVIPADDKENARLIISQILVDHLKGLPLKFPSVSEARLRELKKIGRELKSSR